MKERVRKMIEASLSEPHTSVTAFAEVVCMWNQGFTKFTQLHVVTSQFVMVIPCALRAQIEDRTGSRSA